MQGQRGPSIGHQGSWTRRKKLIMLQNKLGHLLEEEFTDYCVIFISATILMPLGSFLFVGTNINM